MKWISLHMFVVDRQNLRVLRNRDDRRIQFLQFLKFDGC